MKTLSRVSGSLKFPVRLAAAALSLLFLSQTAAAQGGLVAQRVNLKNGKSFSLNLPADYEIVPAAEGLKRVRFFAKAPDGRIFVTDMHDLTDNRRGAVYILEDFNAETGKFGRIQLYLANLRNPNSVAFYTDENGHHWFYLAETHQLTRRRYTPGEIRPTDPRPDVLATFPDYGLDYKYGGWHLTRTLAFSPAGKLYVSVGSSCNACQEKEAERATVLEMNADGSGRRIFARGLRNAVGLKWIGNYLWASNQGSDHLGLNKPDETFYALKDGADYGWASCYQSSGRIYRDRAYSRLRSCARIPVSYGYFPAHSSALGFDYFGDKTADAFIRDSFLVALHGSTNERVGHGYKIVILRKGRRLQDFISGFLVGARVNGRPCDIMKTGENSFLFTDDRAGVVYLVRRRN